MVRSAVSHLTAAFRLIEPSLHDFDARTVDHVEAAWGFDDLMGEFCGFALRLKDGRRFAVQFACSDTVRKETLVVVFIASSEPWAANRESEGTVVELNEFLASTRATESRS